MKGKHMSPLNNDCWRVVILIVLSVLVLLGIEYYYNTFALESSVPVYQVASNAHTMASTKVTGQGELDGTIRTHINVHISNDTTLVDEQTFPGIKTNNSNVYDVLFVDAKPYFFSRTFKTILLWTTFNRKTKWWKMKKNGQIPFVEGKCEVNACFLTSNKSHIKEADFVMFQYQEGPDWPTERYIHQSYVHALKERPIAEQTWLRDYEHRINLTLNYRIDADISFWHFHFPVHEGGKRGPYRLRIPLKEKQFSVVWPVSHCVTDSRRDQYVQELSKHIDVHIYGLCGNYTCSKFLRAENSCFNMFEKSYKFYLSFENAICQDYITEKTTNPMHYELIPVVLGGGDYKKNVPAGSYIDARDFTHPRDLAKHLMRLAKNETDYVRYFQWKQTYGVGKRQDRWCVLCQAAHNKSLVRPAHHDYYNWWHQACDNELVPRMREAAGW